MTAAPSSPRYYVPSNRVGSRLLWAFPLVGGGLALALGLVYALLSALCTQVFESSVGFVLVTPVFGGTLALAGRAVCYLGQVRRASLRLPVMFAVGLLGYYFSWQLYLPMVDDQTVFSPSLTWVMSPPRVFHALVQYGSSQGLGSLGWLLEAAIIFGMIAFLQKSDDEPEAPFCEACGKWTGVVFKLELADASALPAAEHLKRGEVAAVGALKKRHSGDKEWCEVRIFRCPCGASRYVCVHRAKLERGRSAGIRYYPTLAGQPKSMGLDPGSFDETHYSPVLVNLVLDEAGEKALEAVKLH